MSFPVINSVVWRRFPSQMRDDSRRHGHGAFVIDGRIPRSREAPAKRIAETGDLRKMDRNAVSRVSHWGHAISATHGRSSRNAFARRGVGGGEGGGGGRGKGGWNWIGCGLAESEMHSGGGRWCCFLQMHQVVLSKIREPPIGGWGELGMAGALTLALELILTLRHWH